MGEQRRIRYAVVGLGWIAQSAVLPAFRNAKNSTLAALVSDDPTKLRELGRLYGVERLCRYDEYDALLHSGDVDAVYVALPNSLHKDFVVRAGRAGVHVLCEKPLAMTERECEQMIRACRQNDVRLMTAYRLHFEEGTLAALDRVRRGDIGTPRFFHSIHALQVKEGDIRLQQELGGGSLYDLGVYCVNAARHIFGEEPEEVFAYSVGGGDPRFLEVDEMTSAVMRFSGDRLASFTTSFGSAHASSWTVVGTRGTLRMDPAFEFGADLRRVFVDEKGRRTDKVYKARDQFGPELVYFSRCILEDKEPEPNGEEGLADVRVVRALYQSAETGKPVRLGPFRKDRRPESEQGLHLPPVEEPYLVHADEPELKRH